MSSESWYETTPTEYLEPLLVRTEVQIEQTISALEALLVTKEAVEGVLRRRGGANTLSDG